MAISCSMDLILIRARRRLAVALSRSTRLRTSEAALALLAHRLRRPAARLGLARQEARLSVSLASLSMRAQATRLTALSTYAIAWAMERSSTNQAPGC